MKFFSVVVSLSIFLGCGILSVIFGLPERYIERDVTEEEMVGTWYVTPNSESDVNDFMKRFPDWGASAPWKTFTLNIDRSCRLEFETAWLGQLYSKDGATNSVTSCSWNLIKEENLSGKYSPALELVLEYPNSPGPMYSLYIYEENGELIIWDFIGDPDEFRPQDFVKVVQ